MSYTVRQFIRMTPMQKDRLRKRDPQQYDELFKRMEKEFPKETDEKSLKEIQGK